MISEYKGYKETEIGYLKKIPKNWKITRLKSVTNSLTGYPFKSNEYSDKGIKLARGINVKEGVFDWKNTVFWNKYEPYLKKYLLFEGDILIQMDGSKVGKNYCKVRHEDLPILLLQRVTRLRTRGNLLSNFLFYTIASKNFLYWITISKTDPMVPHIAPNDIDNYVIPLPSSKIEQTQIVNYLDQKTQAIDEKVSLLQQKIEVYKELRKSLINQAIAKGLNPNVRFKQSNIDWISNIPEHWETIRMKDVGILYSGLSGKSGKDFEQENNGKSKTYLPFTNVASNTYIDKNALGLVIVEENESQNKIRKNDLFFLMSSEGYEDIGKSALLIQDLDSETYLNSFCKGFRITSKKIVPKYLNWLLLSSAYREKMLVRGKGFTRINLKMDKINDFEICIPNSIKEQEEIANYLDVKTQQIDAIVKNIETQIATFTELRKTLINDVVIGKIKVTA
ncbi:restriction endonuclease subunit S [Flagellimonas pacifica]|uniref:Type I restriction enzyme, S subunit n=1 Tax=Flagellimonas pacifica TaxID=1247520 RepID=A0A285MQV4_9FLAO|nr:restriction endonuclease subunit S [Allomuricauda parva]SNY99562.1 type I restriction enzyme, S subunit [Allomuricauda parva]